MRISAGIPRAILRILIFLALVTSSYILFQWLNAELSNRTEDLKNEMISFLESAVGRKISYGSISPSILMSLEIRDLNIYRADNPKHHLLNLKKLIVKYNFFTLLFGPDPLRAISEIEIQNTHFQIDWQRDHEIVALIKKLTELPPVLYPIRLSGKKLTILIEHEDGNLDARDVFFTMTHNNGIATFNLQKARLIMSGNGDTPFYFESSIRLKSQMDDALTRIDTELYVGNFTSNLFSVSRQTLHLSYYSDVLTVSKIKDKMPLEVQLIWNTVDNQLEILFQSENFSPTRLVTFHDDWSNLNEWLHGTVTGNGSFSYDVAEGQLRYSIDLRTEMENRFLPFPVSAETIFSGDSHRILFDSLHLGTEMGDFDFTGDILLSGFYPQGMLHLTDFSILGGPPVSTSLEITRKNNGISLYGKQLFLGDTYVSALGLDLSLEQEKIHFKGTADLKDPRPLNRIYTHGNILLNDPAKLSLFCYLDTVPIAQVTKIAMQFGVEPLVEFNDLPELDMTAAFFLETDINGWTVASPRIRIYERTDPENTIALTVKASNEGMQINRVEGAWKGYLFSGSGVVSYQQETAKLETSFSIDDVPYWLSGEYRQDGGLFFTGSHGLRGEFDGNFSSASFSVVTEKMPLPVKGAQDLTVSLDIKGRLDEQTGWFILSAGSSLYNLPLLPSGENRVDTTFTYQDTVFEFSRVVYLDSVSTLIGDGKLVVPSMDRFTGMLSLRSEAGREAYDLSFDYHEKEIDGIVVFQETPLDRMGNFIVSGGVDGQIQISGALLDPNFKLNAVLRDGRINVDPISISTEVQYSGDRFDIDSLTIEYRGIEITDASGWHEIESGNFGFDSHVSNTSFKKITEFDSSISGSIESEKMILQQDLFSGNLTADVLLTDIFVDGVQAPSWSVNLSTNSDTIEFSGGPSGCLAGFINSEKDFELTVDHPLPIRGAAIGHLEGNEIQTEFTDLTIDLPLLTRFIGENIFSILEGTASGDLTISGLITDPDFFGELSAEGVIVSFFMTPEITEPFSTTVSLQEKELYIGLSHTRVGPTEVWGQGIITMGHWLPVDYDLNFWSDDPTGLHMAYDFGPVFADGFVTGRIRVNGDRSAIWVDGNVEINYCNISLSTNQTPEIEDEVTRPDLVVDLDLTAGKRIEFLWPSVSFPVLRTYATRGSELFISVSRDTMELIIKGDVGLKGGDVFYFDRNFYFKEGVISFNEIGGSFDPRVTMRAEVRERDENGEEVKIYLTTTNNKLSEFSPVFSSIPNKNELEIVALLGGPIQNQLEQSGLGGSALLLSSEIISQFGILRPFEQRVRQALGLDLFSIRTQILQNVIIGEVLRINKEPESEQLNERISREYLENTTISFGKYIGTDLFLETIVRFTKGGSYGLNTELLISLEWPTPFFNLEWVISPSVESLNELFIRDNSFTFQWRYSY